jgi:hypothetical protein
MSSEAIPPSERLKALERKAKAIRGRLVHAVNALDSRRHQVVRVGTYAKEVAKPAAISILGVAALCGIGALAVGLAIRGRRKRSFSWKLAHTLREMDVVRPPPLGSRIAERVAVTVLTFALTEFAKRAAKNLADGRLPDGRLMVGRALEAHHRELAEGSAR